MSILFAAILAAAPVADEPVQPTGNIQKDFDAATAAANASKCFTAVSLFESLEANPAIKPGSLPASAISVRKGACLIKLGNFEKGEAAILAGLKKIEEAGKDFEPEVADSHVMLGAAAHARWDYVQARQHLEKALARQSGADRIGTLAHLVKATMFESGSTALDFADEGIRLASGLERPSKDVQATFHTLRGRALLNLGRTQEAFDELKLALTLSGGLTSRTTLDEVSMRSDLALAALQLGMKETARKYLAYTGAGRVAESPFATAISMAPPDCGEDSGLKPEDFAVVEFGIASDGSVERAQTVYSRGGPQVAAAFARAVNEWYWLPEALEKIPVFYRVVTRVELRCSTTGGSAPGILGPVNGRFAKWAWPLLRSEPVTSSDRDKLLDELKARVLETQGGSDSQRRIAAIGLQAMYDPRRNAQTLAAIDEAITLAVGAPIPAEIVNSLRIQRLLLTPFSRISGRKARLSNYRNTDFVALMESPEVQRDALAINTVLLLAPDRDRQMLSRVADDDRLDKHHPLRQVALLKLAGDAAGSGNQEAAREYFARTGLTEEQCALIGAPPRMKSSGASSRDFPDEAARFGFEGWVRLEYDITANGRTADARAVIAYPPFVFVDAALGMASGIRYETSYRPSGGVACNAQQETIRFIWSNF